MMGLTDNHQALIIRKFGIILSVWIMWLSSSLAAYKCNSPENYKATDLVRRHVQVSTKLRGKLEKFRP